MRPLHRIAFAWQETRLEIEWANGAEGPATEQPPVTGIEAATEEAQPDALGRRGTPAMCWRDDGDMLFEPLQLRENAEYLVDVTLPIERAEAETRWRGDRSWPLSTVRNAYTSEPPKRWRQNKNSVTIPGRLNFRSYVGAAELRLPGGPAVTVEVACTKIGYFDDLRLLLDAIADEYAALLLEIESPTFSRFGPEAATEPQLLTFLFLLRHAMGDAVLPAAVEHVLGSLRTRTVPHGEFTPLGLSSQPADGDPALRFRYDEFGAGGPLAALFRGFTPQTVLVTRRHETFDTPENRYVKSFLEDVLARAEELRAYLVAQKRSHTARLVERWCAQISDWLRHSGWNEVGRMTHVPSNSQILLKAAGYRDILAAHVRLQAGLELPWDRNPADGAEIHGDLRPISRLYEYWCFFLLRAILRDLCGPEEQTGSTLIRQDPGGLSVTLRKGAESRLEFCYTSAANRTVEVTLFYNKRFEKQQGAEWGGSYSRALNPDLSIRVVCDQQKSSTHWLHFDAKYRLDLADWSEPAEAISAHEHAPIADGSPQTYVPSDLFKMHAYRDALLGSRGSYVIYPGEGENEVFVRYPGAAYGAGGLYVPSVGAFSARPSRQGVQSANLRLFLCDCLERFAEGNDYQEEVGFFATT